MMKPAPDCLLRARTELGEATPIIAFVGDSVSDAIAADRAGVPFIGYAVNARKYAPLLNYGVRRLVKSVSDVETMVVD